MLSSRINFISLIDFNFKSIFLEVQTCKIYYLIYFYCPTHLYRKYDLNILFYYYLIIIILLY